MMGGFHGRILTVDLSSGKWRVENVPHEFYHGFLGGRGIAARYYYERVGPSVDPLGPDNNLIFFTGPLTGVNIPCGAKTGLATKSPLTGHYLCANAGGHFGPTLKAAGYDGLVVSGKASSPVCLFISNQDVELREASDLWGHTAAQCRRRLLEWSPGTAPSIACIGPGGERLVRFASIMADDRAFGRGGAGAVMGSKRLKAIAVAGNGDIPVADRVSIASVTGELGRNVRQGKLNLAEFGTSELTEVMNRLGCYPVRNFRTSYMEGVESITAGTMKKEYWVKNSTCYRCPVACGQVCQPKRGAYADVLVRPEYESTWALGGHCGVQDYSAILSAIHLCDEYGLDAMTTGYMVGFAMDLYEEGRITPKDVDGIPLRFGDGEALVKLVEAIGRRQGLGAELGEGLLPLVHRHPEWEEYAVHVKGMPFAGYDPRAFHGIGLTYGTSSRGACHNVGGWTVSDELLSGKYDRFALAGKGELVRRLQDVRAFVDSTGICTNARRPLGLTDEPQEVVLKMVTGLDLTSRLPEIGDRVYSLERLCLVGEGVTRRDDLLPPRMSVPVPSGPAAGHKLEPADYEVMLDEYYQVRGWDCDGQPKPEKLKALGLDFP